MPEPTTTDDQPALEQDGRNYTAAPGVSEDDTVSVTLTNSYDGRYSDETTVRGPADSVDHDASGGGVVVLRVEGDEYIASVKANGDVTLRRPGDRAGNYVGRVIDSARDTGGDA